MSNLRIRTKGPRGGGVELIPLLHFPGHLKGNETLSIEKRLLSEIEAAQYLGVSPGYLRKSRMTGDIGQRRPGPVFCKFGRTIRYDLNDLDAWITAHKRGGKVVA